MTDPFADLESDLDSAPIAKPKEKIKYPCAACCGTGKYQGVRYHQEKAHCFACRGKGYFLTSPEQRHRAKMKRQQLAAKKEREKQERISEWKIEHADLYKFLLGASGWNNFAMNLLSAISQYGGLTPNQHTAAMNMYKKHLVRQEKIAAEKPTIDLNKFHELFNNASNSGLSKPKLRLGTLTLSIAPENGKNAGCIYVKDDGEYAGKITPEGKFWGIREHRQGVENELVDIAKDPFKHAVIHGKKTGKCACCGRTLTNKLSIELGIGPICRSKWGL